MSPLWIIWDILNPPLDPRQSVFLVKTTFPWCADLITGVHSVEADKPHRIRVLMHHCIQDVWGKQAGASSHRLRRVDLVLVLISTTGVHYHYFYIELYSFINSRTQTCLLQEYIARVVSLVRIHQNMHSVLSKDGVSPARMCWMCCKFCLVTESGVNLSCQNPLVRVVVMSEVVLISLVRIP